jgi:hypothetical protein
LISLLLLRHLLGHVEPDKDVDLLRPCDYFTMICGSSVGGVVALMLGRLEMSIGEAIQAFERFTKSLYSDGDAVIKSFLEGGELAENGRLKQAVDEFLADKDVSMRKDGLKSHVRSYVCSMCVSYHRISASSQPSIPQQARTGQCHSFVLMPCQRMISKFQLVTNGPSRKLLVLLQHPRCSSNLLPSRKAARLLSLKMLALHASTILQL